MIDREKVLTWLTICGENSDCSGCCPYHEENRYEGSIECMSALMRDALGLLKNDPLPVLNVGKFRIYYGDCPHCGERIYYKKTKYCPYCGKAVKWDV